MATIRMRPYYLYAIFRQLACGDTPAEDNSLPSITRQLIDSRFQDEIQLVQGFCDVCRGCPRMSPSNEGSLWGPAHRCGSTDTRKRLHEVENQMRSILYDLELLFNQVMRADALLHRAIERRPFHYSHNPDWQRLYEKGVERFTELTGLKPRIDDKLLAVKPFYFQ